MLVNDKAFVVVNASQINTTLSAFGHEEKKAKKILIVGGGNIGFNLAKNLETDSEGVRVKIIEKNKDRAEFIANELNNTIVINGNGLDEDVLKEANIEESETVLSLTNDDEDNIMVSVLAEKNNPNKRTIALVNKQNYSLLQSSLKINDLVDPRQTTISTILKHVHKGTIETVYTLLDGEYEFIEAEILETSELISKSIKDSNLPKEIRIGAIVRGKDYFKIPISDQSTLKKLSSEIHNDEINGNGDENNSEDNNIKDNNNLNKNTEELLSNQFEKIKNKYSEKKRKYLNFFKKYKIQDVIKPRQVILVQINKEERGLKGSALTTFLSFAGRYCVLMPNSLNNDGISRKISDIEERKKIKSILESIKLPDNMSVIVRTAGIGKTKKEINKDLEFLVSQWNKIREKTLKSTAPKLIYEEGNLVKRTLRDLLANDVDEVIIDGKEGYDFSKKFVKKLIPSLVKKIRLFKKDNKTLFNDNKIEHQINELFSLKINLESGGSIVINNTEALVAIDVNSGKNTIERNIESTALKTNLQAATEIARQLRLRDLGGLIVIDFIDMDDYRNNFKVEKAIKTALYRDRAKVQVGRISMFGLLELSRQRLRSSLIERSFQKCPYCNGSGIILNTTSISDQILKVVNEKLIDKKNIKVEVKCNTALADILLNSKRNEIQTLENEYDSKILFTLDNHYSLHEPEISLLEDNVKSNEKKSHNKIPKKRIIKKKKIPVKVKLKSVKKKSTSVSTRIGTKSTKLNDDEINKKTGWWTE